MSSLDWPVLQGFVGMCGLHGVEPPAATVRGVAMLQVAEGYRSAPSGAILGMTDDELREHIASVSVREHQGPNASMRGMAPGIEEVRSRLADEIREMSIEGLDRITEQMRPEFEQITLPLTEAVKAYSFTSGTTSDEIVLAADERVSAAWRACREAITALAPIARFRNMMDKTYDLVPDLRDASEVGAIRNGSRPVNPSVNFVGTDAWSADDGYLLDGAPSGLDWMSLASTGSLTLNTPSQVRAKLLKRGIRKLEVERRRSDVVTEADILAAAEAGELTYPLTRPRR